MHSLSEIVLTGDKINRFFKRDFFPGRFSFTLCKKITWGKFLYPSQ